MRRSSRAAMGLLVSSCFLLSLAGAGLAQIYGPKLLLQEDVTCDYYWNGSVKTDVSMTGQPFVGLPNNDDVLQYIRIEFASGYDKWTNIKNATGAYHDAAVSSNDNWGWWNLYVNTTSSGQDSSYAINDSDQAPTINLTMYYSNDRGGKDLYDEQNIDDPDNNITAVFSLENPSSSRDLVDVTANVYFNLDSSGTDDVQVIYTESDTGSASSAASRDSESPTDDDWVTWTGDINANSVVNVTVVLNLTSGVHLGTGDSVDMQEAGEDGANTTYSNTSYLFSDITVSDKFSRGPIRQGVDLSSSGGFWYVRGFIRNMGNADSGQNLTYNVTRWDIYSVDPATGGPYGTANQTGEFNQSASASEIGPDDGRIYTTDSRSSNTSTWNSSSTSKPYMSVGFTWEVIWNSSNGENNLSYINTSMDLTTLYLLDIAPIQQAPSGTVSPEVGGEEVSVQYDLTNVGHNSTEPHFVELLAYVPANTSNGLWRDGDSDTASWNITNAQIFLNDSYEINPDGSNCALTVTNTTQSSDGLVNFTVYNLPDCTLTAGGTVGHTFDSLPQQDFLNLTFTIVSDSDMNTGDTYVLWGKGTINSSTNTQDSEWFNNQSVTVSGKRVTGYKELIAYDTNIPTLINATINLSIEDTEGSGISGIKFMDYLPNVISYADYVGNFSDGSWYVIKNGTVLTYGDDYDITDNSTVTLPDGLTARAVEFVNTTATANTTWNLTDGEYIQVVYQINFTSPGAYILPTTIAAFDPDTGASLETTIYGVVKVSIPEPDLPLSIDEGTLELSKTVLVGKPAVWTKGFDVYNPNPRAVKATFEAVVFDDASDGYVTYFSESGRKVEENVQFAKDSEGRKVMRWESLINPLENRNYEVSVLTPPVLEIDRDVEVLEQLPEKKVRLKMDVYLKSFSEEGYENVILNLPIAYSKIEEVRDGFGERLAFTGGPRTSSVTVDRMGSGELKTVSVIYRESYPTIIITPDRDRYDLNAPVSLEILVINGGERIDYPFLEIEIYTPGMDVIFSDVERLQEMEPLEKTEMYERFVIPAAAPSGMYIASAKFREDFAVLASATGNFYVLGAGGGIPGAIEVMMVILVSVVLVYFSWRRLREVRGPKRYGGI